MMWQKTALKNILHCRNWWDGWESSRPELYIPRFKAIADFIATQEPQLDVVCLQEYWFQDDVTEIFESRLGERYTCYYVNGNICQLILVRGLSRPSPIRSVIIWVITKLQESDLLITSMITDWHQTTLKSTYQLIIKITIFEKRKKWKYF